MEGKGVNFLLSSGNGISHSMLLHFIVFCPPCLPVHQWRTTTKWHAHYKSALTVPLRLQYIVDLPDSLVAILLKAMFLQHSKASNAVPAWYLNGVLTYINGLQTSLRIETSLQECAFSLTTCYWVEVQWTAYLCQGHCLLAYIRWFYSHAACCLIHHSWIRMSLPSHLYQDQSLKLRDQLSISQL